MSSLFPAFVFFQLHHFLCLHSACTRHGQSHLFGNLHAFLHPLPPRISHIFLCYMHTSWQRSYRRQYAETVPIRFSRNLFRSITIVIPPFIKYSAPAISIPACYVLCRPSWISQTPRKTYQVSYRSSSALSGNTYSKARNFVVMRARCSIVYHSLLCAGTPARER